MDNEILDLQIKAMQAQIAKKSAPQQPPAQKFNMPNGYFDNLTNSLASGASFGLADEIGALGTAAGRSLGNITQGNPAEFGSNYDAALAQARGQQKEFSQQNPKADITANVVGSFANPLAKAFKGGGTLLQNTKNAAIVSGEMGAAYGAGNAEGGVGDRARSAATQGLGAAVLGAAAVPLFNALGYGVNRGVKAIKKVLDRSGTTTSQLKIAQAIQRLGDGDMKKGIAIVRSRIQKGGPGTVLADVLDIGGQRTARGAANIPGPSTAQADKFVAARQVGRGDRLQAAADTLSKNTFHESIDQIAKAQAAKASPLYEKAFSAGTKWDKGLQRFLDQPDVRKGMAVGIKNMEREAVGTGQPFNFQDFAVKGVDDAGNVIIDGVPNLRAMDAAKRGLDAMINAEKNPLTGKLSASGRSLEILRKGLVSKLDKITTDRTGQSIYKAAREAWAGPQRILNAAENGRKFLRNDFEVTAKKLANMPEAEREAFRLGVRREMSKLITTDTQTAVNKFASKKADFWHKLEAVFPDKKSLNQFRFKIKQEAKKQRLENFISPRAGSHTTPMSEDIADFASVPKDKGPMLEAVSQLVRGNFGRAAGAAATPVFDRLTRPNQKVAIQILNKMLTNGEPLAQALPKGLRDTIPPQAIEAASRALMTTGASRR